MTAYEARYKVHKILRRAMNEIRALSELHSSEGVPAMGKFLDDKTRPIMHSPIYSSLRHLMFKIYK